jgi:methylated-DNA-[protein]-cysteine S-methyltransferase
MVVAASSKGVIRVGLPGEAEAKVLSPLRKCTGNSLEQGETDILRQAKEELIEFFQGKRQKFDVPTHFEGTDFQKRVWRALMSIPYGETRSYQNIACEAGNVRAVRAVGMANNRNPIPIIVPCHRVIGKNGSLVGYGGGLQMKKRLLSLESG